MAQKPAGPGPDPQSSVQPSNEAPEWTPVVRTKRRRVVAGIVALAMLMTAVLGAAVSILAAMPASAHDQLISSDPADGEDLDEPVDSVRLTYSAEIIPEGTQVRVVTPEDELDAEIAIDGEDVTATFDAPDVGGDYLVQWRVVSSDGHPIEGELAYTVAEQAEPAAEPSEPSDAGSAEAELEESGEMEGLGAAAPEPSPTQASPVPGTDGDDAGAMPLVYGAALVAMVGVAVAFLMRSRRRLHETTARGPGEGPEA